MKPKIVILSAFLTPYRSGAEACAEEVAIHLKDRYDITIITARLRRSLPARDALQGVSVIRVGLGLPLDKWLFPFLAPFAAKKLQPDIIHAVLESFAGLALVCSKVIVPKPKRILTCQSTNTSYFLIAMHLSAHVVTVISSVLMERAKQLGRGDAILIPNGIHYEQIRETCIETPKVPGRILYVGRLEPMKGVDTLLRAFAELVSTQSKRKSIGMKAGEKDIQLRVVGDGSERASLEKLSQELGISNRVTFCGYISAPDLYKEFAAAEIFCGLSRSEALGNVFIEAQAAGCAVLATNVGGIPDVIRHEDTGLLIAPNDPAAAAERLQRFVDDQTLRETVAASAIKNAAAYDWEGIAERYGEVYEKLIY